MKTQLVTLLLVGLNSGLFVGLAQNNPASDDKVQKLYNQPANTPKPAGGAPEAATPAPEPVGELLPLVQFEDAPLVDVIKTLARQANLNVIFDPKVTQLGADGKSPYPSVSIRLESVTAQNVLEAVLNNNNLKLDKDPKTKISRVTVKDPAAAEPLVTKIYQLKYTSPSNLVSIITPSFASGRSKAVPDNRTSQLIVQATEKEILEVDPLIEKLDTPTRQVLIEARILETEKTPETSKGINWEKTFGGQNFAFGNNVTGGQGGRYSQTSKGSIDPVLGPVVTSTYGDNNLLPSSSPGLLADTAHGFNPKTAFLDADGVRGVLSWFNKDNQTEVIATPRAVTADNTQTTLSVTRALPIFKVTAGGTQSGPTVDITYTNVGIILNVTPRISANDSVALRVIPEVSNVEETKDLQTIAGLENTANIYAIRKIETQVLIPSGNTLVMGGLISDNTTKTQTKVPILGDIPGVGYAFRSSGKKRDRRNLIIFITPTIVTDDDFAPTQTDFLKKKAPVDRPDSDEAGFDNLLDSAKPHDWSKPVY
jgi:type II secretory pathway component GspD/PulD (secretin)